MSIAIQPEGKQATNGVIQYYRSINKLDTYISTFGTFQRTNTDALDYSIENILNLSERPFYASGNNKLFDYVGVNLTHHTLVPTHYTICQYNNAGYYLKNWRLEAQLTVNDNWDIIHEKK